MVIGEGKADPSYDSLMNLFHFSQKTYSEFMLIT